MFSSMILSISQQETTTPELPMCSLPCNSKIVRRHQGDPRVVVAIYYSIVPVQNFAEIAKSFFSRPTTGPSALGLWVN